MKKIILFGIATFMAMGLYSNPNPSPEVHINEFLFTGTNSWSMELYFYYCNPANFDSITVQSNSGIAKVINYQGGSFLYFTDQDLSTSLTINRTGDVILLVAHNGPLGDLSCKLSFGNVSNPDVTSPLSGQSIARFESANCFYPPLEIFSLSNHPTLGIANDTTGTFGTVVGTVYDINGQPVSYQAFKMDCKFTTDAAGNYSTPIYSRIYSWDTICYERYPGNYSYVKTSPISYTMHPDSSIIRDIHLLSTLLVGTPPPPKKAGSDFNVFPNPVGHLITISYSTELSAKKCDLHIDIIDMSGKKLITKYPETRLGVIKIPVDLPNGIYIAKMTGGGNVLGSARFIVNTAE
jgi:hypothetical protein